jgi:hypothetical protein
MRKTIHTPTSRTTSFFQRLRARPSLAPAAAILLAFCAVSAPALAAPESDEAVQETEPLLEGEDLTQELKRRDGVITPPPAGDPGIYTEAPDPAPGTTPVIPPEELPEQQ